MIQTNKRLFGEEAERKRVVLMYGVKGDRNLIKLKKEREELKTLKKALRKLKDGETLKFEEEIKEATRWVYMKKKEQDQWKWHSGHRQLLRILEKTLH